MSATGRILQVPARTRIQDCGSREALGTKRVHTSDRRSLTEASLAAETDESRGEVSRLKAGCSQDCLPHKRRINNPPQVNNLPHKHEGFWECERCTQECMRHFPPDRLSTAASVLYYK